MTDTLKRVAGPSNLASGTSTVLTVTSSHTFTIKWIRIVNNSGVSITVKLGIGGVAAANLILPPTAVGDGESLEFDGVLTMDSTETLQANTTASGLTITVSALDQS